MPTPFTNRAITLQTSSFSDWTISDGNNTLPVTLTNFTGKRTENANQLSWTTASEINNNGFELQRSTNGETFETIAFVKGNGTTNEKQQYSFTDLYNSNAYYRLKQVDFDGKFEYSKSIYLAVDGSELKLALFPNPVQNEVNIEGLVNATTGTIYNMHGAVVKTISLEPNTSVDVSDLKQGLYTIQIEGINLKFLKK